MPAPGRPYHRDPLVSWNFTSALAKMPVSAGRRVPPELKITSMIREPAWPHVPRFRPSRFVGALVRRVGIALLVVAGCSDGDHATAVPASAGPNEGPNATETNFFPIPCDEESDCAEGLRCELADAPDGGVSRLGRCVREN